MSKPKIQLQTRERWDIPNFQETTVTGFYLHQDRKLRETYEGPGVEFRTDIIPIYNCHGLTFAARRTWIDESPSIARIISDDKYQEIAPDKVLPGDVIIFYGDDGDIEHSGIVLKAPDQDLKIPLILSKWGLSGEVIHWANRGPYSFERPRYYRITK
jgi:hypothetical protein